MKKIVAAIALFAATLAVHALPASFVTGVLDCKLTALSQGAVFALVSSKTNTTATSTNYTLNTKSTVNATNFDNAAFLVLIENSFNTSFPAGSQVGFRLGQLCVVDSTGTNVIFDPTSVVNFHIEGQVLASKQTEKLKVIPEGLAPSGNLSEVVTESAIIEYDDSTRTTADGTHTVIQIKGLMINKLSRNLATSAEKESITFNGTGAGSVRDQQTIITGTITVKAAGSQPLV